MKLGIPLLVGGASATGVALTGGYYVFFSKGPTIKEKLKSAKLIADLDPSFKTKQWQEEFKSDKENIKKLIPDLKDVSIDEDGGRKLEQWCSSQMDLDSKKNSSTFELVRKYCLVRDLVSQLNRNNKSILGKEQAAEWSAVYQKRKSSQSKREDVGLTGGTTWTTLAQDKETEEISAIQKWCENTGGEDFLASDNNSKYDKLLKWCTEGGKSIE